MNRYRIKPKSEGFRVMEAEVLEEHKDSYVFKIKGEIVGFVPKASVVSIEKIHQRDKTSPKT